MPSVEELIAAANPHPTAPDPAEVDAALKRVLAHRAGPAGPDAPSGSRNRRRRGAPVAVASAAAALAAAVVLSATGVGGPSGGHAAANSGRASSAHVARLVADVIDGPDAGILHVVIHGSSGPVGGPQMTDADASWTQLDGGHASWDRVTWETGTPIDGSTSEAVVTSNSVEQYSSLTNMIIESPVTSSTRPGPLGDVAFGITGALAGEKLPEVDRSQPENFAAQVTALLHNPDVAVDQSADFHGQPAISLYSAAAQDTLYVRPGTYQPLGVVMISPCDGHDCAVGGSYQQVFAFETWQVLPDGSVPIPNLTQLHPTAAVHVATSATNG